MIYLYLFGTCFHFIYVFMIIGNIKKYDGMFPEIYTGVDYGIYPRPRQYNMGVKINF